MNNSFWQGKKVLVTGGSGFVGSHFIEELIKLDAQVTSVYRNQVSDISIGSHRQIQLDVTDYSALLEALEGQKVIVNCAAMDGNADFKKKYAAKIMDTNMRITSNILNAARVHNISKVVLLSSAEVYAAEADSPIEEEDDYRKYNDYTTNGYILSKRYSEILATLYEEQYGTQIYLPRPTNIYGPRDHFDGENIRVIPSMIKKIMNNQTIDIWGDGSQIRQFIYVKDLVFSIFELIESETLRKLNIASPEGISIAELARNVCRICGEEEKIHFDTEKPVGSKNRLLSTDKLQTLGITNTVELEEGLMATVLWYKKKTSKL